MIVAIAKFHVGFDCGEKYIRLVSLNSPSIRSMNVQAGMIELNKSIPNQGSDIEEHPYFFMSRNHWGLGMDRMSPSSPCRRSKCPLRCVCDQATKLEQNNLQFLLNTDGLQAQSRFLLKLSSFWGPCSTTWYFFWIIDTCDDKCTVEMS